MFSLITVLPHYSFNLTWCSSGPSDFGHSKYDFMWCNVM